MTDLSAADLDRLLDPAGTDQGRHQIVGTEFIREAPIAGESARYESVARRRSHSAPARKTAATARPASICMENSRSKMLATRDRVIEITRQRRAQRERAAAVMHLTVRMAGLLATHSPMMPNRLLSSVKVRRKSIQICRMANTTGGSTANSSGMRGANAETSSSQP